MMPQFNFTSSVAAGASYTPLSNWQFRFPPKPGLMELLINATAVGCVFSLTTGPESIVQADNPVSAGGTTGVLPARLNTEPVVDKVNAGEETVVTVRNTSGGAVVINGVAILTYA
jgi:hypothetical protein